ncbi:rhodanese-like domain-containing protein [Flavobacterium faecale]|uniref:Rhodanese-like domain-containing protein n=1 Tax=Flavobacterium faecale TaxID=1355330 RepID=A0A2S1LCT6_9FLAO|nr:rhodanese-like domain-containing protein [Flavobacterium faecale]AWG21570.1 rhodanese-like domain-containing protein [Flavobacterium faecale]
MKIKILFFIFTSALFLSCNGQNAQNQKTVAAQEFQKEIANTEKPQLIDVRTPEEFESEHLVNATNINWTGTTFEADAQKLDKTKPVYVYCRSGGRSKKACSKLAELGFTNIIELDGGFLQWSAEGLKSNKN